MRCSLVLFLIIISTHSLLGNESTDSNLPQTSNSDGCPADEIISKMLDIFTPEDYEEGKNDIKSDFESFNDTLKSINRLQEYSRNVSQKMSDFTKRMNSRMSETLMAINLPTDCMTSFARIMSAAKNGELWAIKFFEAQPRPNNGVLEMTGLSFGNYDQCLSIESPEEENKPQIRGQYCSVDLEPYYVFEPSQFTPEIASQFQVDNFIHKLVNQTLSNTIKTFYKRTYDDWLSIFGLIDSVADKSMKLVNGLCLPTTCTPRDVSLLINEMTYPITRIPFQLGDDCEYIGKPVRLNNYQIVSIIGLGSLLAVFVFCSVIDCLPKTSFITKSLEKTFAEFFIKCFSFKRNIESVFGVKQYSKFKALDGFRAILTFYVVLLHNYEIGVLGFFNKNHYLSASYKMTMDYRNMVLPNMLLMDNFMIISGFLLGNTILSRLMQSKGKFNYIHYILFRYLRILPMMVCGLFFTFLFDLIGDGPLWHNVKLFFVAPCYDKWHKPLLMYNNKLYYPNENSTVQSSVQCMTITWYASMDFQLYAMAPISFLLLYKSRKYGLILNFFLLIFSILLPVFNKVVLGLPHFYEALAEANANILMSGFAVSYWGPINYMQTYIMGILLAYAVRNKPNVYLGGRIGELFIWIVSAFMTFLILYWQRNFILPGYAYDNLNGQEIPVYLLIHKWVYLSSFAWLIFACTTGRGGFINEALGWKGFKVIDNLGLEIYVMHVFLFVYRLGSNRDQRTYTDYHIWTSAIFDFVVCYVISAIVALVITRPFANMTMALLKPQTKTKKDFKTNLKNKSLDNQEKFETKTVTSLTEGDIKLLNIIYHDSEKVIYRM